MDAATLVALIVVLAVAPVVISMIIEALRKPPETPQSLYWAPTIPIQYTSVDGMRIRYIKTGQGPNLVLLHTLRTELDIFQKVIPDLAREFTVYALDYPGHGFSDIPLTDYRPELFVRVVEGFLAGLKIDEATLAGVSIGGVIPLLVAAKHNTRVRKVVAINPYDYGKGGGISRGNFVAWLIFTLAKIPVLGETVMRFRNRIVERLIIQGGVATPEALPGKFLEQLFAEGERKHHYRGFLNLIRNAHHWEEAHQRYGQITIPVLLVYGERDWSRVEERDRTARGVPGARMETVANGGHFLSLDQPHRVVALIKEFAAA